MAYYPYIVGLLMLALPAYNIFLHPLRSYPGPWYSRVSRLWYFVKALRGVLPYEIKSLHDKYGPVVRIAPNELSYNGAEAWQDIYGRNYTSASTAKQLFRKDPVFYSSFLDHEDTMVDAEQDPYRDQKKPLAHGFSKGAISRSQDILSQYQHQMIEELKEYVGGSKRSVNIGNWISNALLDITTRLTVDRDHDGIKHGDRLHPALAILNDTMRFLWVFLQFQRLPGPIIWCIRRIFIAMLGQFKFFEKNDLSSHLVRDRLEHGSSRPDYVSYLIQSPEHVEGIKVGSLVPKAIFLILAGTETTATALSGAIYYLLANRRALQRAEHEVRKAFKNPADINIESTRNLEYLMACMYESQRMYPSTPGAFPREVPQGGANVCQQHVPGNTIVGISHFAAFRSGDNFRNPDQYLPERWLENESPDKRDAFHPFSFGPRICIGKELALANMRQIMARLLWEFDMEIAPEAVEWINQRTGLFPFREPFHVIVNKRHPEL